MKIVKAYLMVPMVPPKFYIDTEEIINKKLILFAVILYNNDFRFHCTAVVQVVSLGHLIGLVLGFYNKSTIYEHTYKKNIKTYIFRTKLIQFGRTYTIWTILSIREGFDCL